MNDLIETVKSHSARDPEVTIPYSQIPDLLGEIN